MIKTILYTNLALVAFAGNSVLCRLALGENKVDAASFTIIRLLSGIAVLFIILNMTPRTSRTHSKGNWSASLMLFVYAVTFSFAYKSLDTGVGALILFGSVQITMIIASLIWGNKLHISEWLGLLIAFLGLVYLIMPTLTSPSLFGFLLMMLSGASWALYSLAGKESQYPLVDTTYNFIRTLPLVVVLTIITFQHSHLTQQGVIFAILSGGITSGIGYAIWYVALKGLSTTLAAAVMLLVPVIATIGGVLFVNEAVTLRLVLSSIIILGGILIVIIGKSYYLTKRL